jgi:L-alanine-DL-glutamate epimerase-like enolase superfamily enzyme
MKITAIDIIELRVPGWRGDSFDGSRDDCFIHVHTDDGVTGIDMAPWDIRAKTQGKPLCEVLGRKRRARPASLLPPTSPSSPSTTMQSCLSIRPAIRRRAGNWPTNRLPSTATAWFPC